MPPKKWKDRTGIERFAFVIAVITASGLCLALLGLLFAAGVWLHRLTAGTPEIERRLDAVEQRLFEVERRQPVQRGTLLDVPDRPRPASGVK